VSDGAEDRLEGLTDLVLRLAAGEYETRGEPSPRHDGVDALTVGLNLLAETLEMERQGREEAEALLHDERHAYEHAPAMFCSIAVESYALVKCNATFAKVIGTDEAAPLGRSLLDFVPEDERPRLRSALDAISNGDEPSIYDFVVNGADDGVREVAMSASLLTEEGAPERIRLVLRDVTDERSLEAQLRQAQKLEAVGRLAAGVAHDFNNLLTVVAGAASSLRELLDADHPGVDELSLIREAGERAAGLTRQLLAFGRPDVARPRVHDINALVRGSRQMLERTLGEKGRLELALHPSSLPVHIDATHLVQVLLNITFNARDAMAEEGGVVSLRTAKGGEDGGQAVLVAHDDGHGMSAEVLERAIEPFFSTKEAAHGSGLGLAVCYGIVTQAGGSFELQSQPAQGTTVRVGLPLAPAATIAASPREVAQRTNGRGQRVLVVDDTKLVRVLMKKTLERAGYDVVSADGGAEALAVLDGSPPAILVTDVVMPEMSGPDLATALWCENADLPVLFVSGYAGDDLDDALLERPNVRFLQKPFQPSHLFELVDELISSKNR